MSSAAVRRRPRTPSPKLGSASSTASANPAAAAAAAAAAARLPVATRAFSPGAFPPHPRCASPRRAAELRRKFGIEVTDKDRTWMATGPPDGDGGGYRGGRTSIDEDDERDDRRGRGRGRDEDDEDEDDVTHRRADDDADAGGGPEDADAKPEEEQEANGH